MQDYRKVKEESKETMALEVVTDDKKLKRMTRNMYTTREHKMGHVFCVPPSFVLTDINNFFRVLL